MAFFKLKGVIPPMITPFKENGDVDYDKHIVNVKKWNNYDLGGYLVLGSNSETVYLNEEEKLELIRLTVENKKDGIPVLVGTALESTKETIKLTNKAAQLGADAALLVTPFYYGSNMNDEALIGYYTEVADEIEIPALIYNVTKFTHVNISPKAVSALAGHPNIIGMKDSSGSIPQLIDLKRAVGDNDFNLMVGTASAWYPALTLGIEASVMALVNCCPEECVNIQKEYDAGNYKKSQEIYERVFPVNSAVTGKYGIAGLKYACDLLGFNGGYVRKPMLQIKENDKKELEKILGEAGLL
ncbi:dihydrodipicolinate synthase family protein [Anaeropeptidivorans aminofermentans]|jgi:4-hydroxy-2-oxoglutarate aldolase|uniref:dihydrodipicolinate synthase family protein n=1 Tax=Anaeropeptidivorans aminofermentans TaxID=2934315 RepID=UPI002024A4D9|nr:dihydrodipicolinate synthase family protein [Anaeropeptidivorans aminofermentans]